MHALTLLTNYVRNTPRTLSVALFLPVSIAAPVTIITAPVYAQGVPVVDTQNIAQKRAIVLHGKDAEGRREKLFKKVDPNDAAGIIEAIHELRQKIIQELFQ